MSKKLDHHLIKKYYCPAETKPKKPKYASGLITIALLFTAVTELSGPIDAVLVAGVFLVLYLFIAWVTKPNRPEDIGELSAEFRKDGVRILATVDNLVGFQEKIKLSDIKTVSGYIQDGWLWVRDRGILLETNQDPQFRLSLNLNRQGLDNLLVSLQPSLSDMNYNIGKLRKFQP
ncbi:hypothetical protein FBY03_102337 [Pseudomonas sp. SJZ079]|uniref:hypothetical protein n=1 Tax=Pseudomonas sp. SJZ079 TaxID=2572887 RepID=UPI0011995367|nr:hypothetical protein [Pseudomonas sp. SJZ079]TWC41588.1 hypothetical protein FBY03_102337 [Pseudomonas sp. SJZ079]